MHFLNNSDLKMYLVAALHGRCGTGGDKTRREDMATVWAARAVKSWRLVYQKLVLLGLFYECISFKN